MYKDVAVSPGGMYTIVSTGSGAHLKLKIFGNTGGDKTPDFPYKNVKFVFANDKGLFFAQVVLNKIEFYQVGEYQTEYKPDIQASPTPEISPSGLYHFANGRFDPAGDLEFGDLIPGDIYMAGRNINFDMGSGNGTLHILNGTYFSVDQNHRPIILRGQLTAEFNSPTTVYAIKFDRFLMDLFKTKLSQFIAGTLPDDEYFIVKNIHTKFTVKNNEGKFNVTVDSGEVKVTGDKINLDIKQGRQIIIDKNNEIKVTGYINFKTLSIIIGLIILILGAVLFYYRKTKVGKKIIEILNVIGKFILKLLKNIILILWKGIRFLYKLIVDGVKKIYEKRKQNN